MIVRLYTLLVVFALPLLAQDEFGSAERQQVLDGLQTRLEPVMGDEWESLYSKYRKPLADASSKDEFYRILRQMFDATGKSHFMVGAPNLQKLESKVSDRSGSAGLELGLVEGKLMVLAITPGGAADSVAIKPGFSVEAVNGVAMAPFIKTVQEGSRDPYRQQLTVKLRAARWFSGPPGRTLELTVRDYKDIASSVVLEFKPGTATLGSMGHLRNQPMDFQSKRLADGSVGYIRFSIFLMPLLKKIRTAVKSFRGCKGIILDIRGNPGGLSVMAMPIAGMFVDKQLSLGQSRSGDDVLKYPVFPALKPYPGKLIILTDELSASTSEVLAAGLQETGRAVIVGNRTRGAVLPSLIIKLDNGATIQYPIGDFKTPKGTSLEGRGVTPDHAIPFSREALKNTTDLAVDTAIAIINKD